MKLTDAINEVNSLKPNMYDDETKIRWLSRLESRIYQDVILTHEYNEGEDEIAFTPYTVEDGEKTLIVGEPYDELYVRWLEAMIDYNNREFDAFNNSNAVFEAVYSSFFQAYNRSHMPKGKRNSYY